MDKPRTCLPIIEKLQAESIKSPNKARFSPSSAVFGKSRRAGKKQRLIDKLKTFFEK